MTPTKQEPHNPTPARNRRHATVLFADMVGYSRHLEEDENRNAVLAARSVELFRGLIADYGGQIANVAGDGILALFDSARLAVRFAVQMQVEIREHAVWANGEPIRFRIGVHIGEISIDNGNVQGHCVNIAARLQQDAKPGEVLISAALRAAIAEESDLALSHAGARVFKNIREAVEVFSVGLGPRSSVQSTASMPERAQTLPAPARRPSIAVLVFSNRSGDPADLHVCQGIAEDLISNLSRFRDLMVIARHSAFLFDLRAQSARNIGRALGVHYLLSGSLRRSGTQLQVSVELIDATSERVEWSDRFDIAMTQLFDLQDEITGAAASRLAVQIGLVQHKHESQHPQDLRAYGLVLRGQQLMQRYTKEANAHARRLFDEAIALAPDYSRAYSALARAHNYDWRYSWSTSPERSLASAIDLAGQAVLRDPMDARGFAELGYGKLYQKRHDAALANYVRAISLNPNDADILAEYADALVYSGDPAQAIELFAKATRLNPFYPDWYLWFLADAYNALGRSEDVIKTVQRMQNVDEGRRLLAANLAHLGRLNEAREQAREVLRLHPEFTIGQWRDRPPYRDAVVLERYVDGLRKAGLPE